MSKNNEADAKEGFNRNPRMPLSWSDLTATRVDWTDKASNLRATAVDLGLGTDSFVFFDDNPLEVALMREHAPEVTTLHAEGTANGFQCIVLDGARFHSVALTDEDRSRADSYQAEQARTTAQAHSGDLNSFLTGLNLKLTFRPPHSTEIERIAQLFIHTNQFNLTTIRYTPADVIDLMKSDLSSIHIARLQDRFGDYGTIGIVVTRDLDDSQTRDIDSYLMSCRVLGRKVEDAVLARVENDARKDGVARMTARNVSTAKNGMVSGFYDTHGFTSGNADGHYERDLTATDPMPIPDWIDSTEEG